MQYTIYDRFKNYTLQHRKFVVLIACIMIISSFVLYFGKSFSVKIEEEKNEFSEIQKFRLKMEVKDYFLKNRYHYEKVNKVTKGIDVSSWQGDIDWDLVSESGIDFVMIRCGFRNLNDSEIHIDKNFIYNVSEANRVGIPVGIYFYSTAISDIEALEEASFVLNLINDFNITYPVVYDFENFNKNRTVGIDATTVNNNARIFLDYISSHGYDSMIYFNLRAMESYIDLEYYNVYDKWIAHYNEDYDYEGIYDMWQYSDVGRIDGIKGNVDLNIAYFGYEI